MPAIDAILTAPGLASNRALGHPRTGRVTLVGVALDDGHIGWGVCPLGVPARPGLYPEAPEIGRVAALMADLVEPALRGRAVGDWPALSALLEGLTEVASINRPAAGPAETALSRRAVLTGQLQKATGALVERLTVERPLHPALRFGLSQALLAAYAQWRGLSPAAALAQTYDLSPATTMIPIQTVVRGGQALALDPSVAALSYEVTAADPQAGLGGSGEKLQGFVRQLRQAIASAVGPAERPAIHLRLAGQLGRLFENDLGRILGALSGLEQAAAPYPLRVEDPLRLDDPREQRAALSRLRDYLRMRQMSTSLVSGEEIDSIAGLEAFLSGEGETPPVHLVHLQIARLGAIHQSLAAVAMCRAAGAGVLLGGAPADALAHVALAVRADAVAAPPGQAALARLHNEMARFVASLRPPPGA
jgi:methylaspartate ammonia-lyase